MKVLGKFMGESNERNCAVGSYAVYEAEWANVETYTGASVQEDEKCFLKLGTTYLVLVIKKADGEYMDPETANSLVKDIAMKEIVNLDDYNMGFFDIKDIRPDSICITNEVDEDFCAIPLEVVVK